MIPSLSQISSYDSSHLMVAAAHWDETADRWELTQAQVKTEAMGLNFTGATADALHDRVALDHMHAVTSATALREAAAVASQAADMLDSAKRRVLSKVMDAQDNGFAVGEDYSVTDERGNHRISRMNIFHNDQARVSRASVLRCQFHTLDT